MMRNIIILFFLISCFFKNGYAQNSLQSYIDKAIENSPLLQKQENNNKIIDLDLKQFNAIYKAPKLNLNTNVLLSPILSQEGNKNKLEWVSAGSTNYIGYDLGASNGGQFQALISVNQPLFTGKYYNAQKDKATIAKAKNENRTQLTKAKLQQIVTHQYILCVQSQKLKNNNQKTIQIIEEQIAQIKILVNAGIYKLIDLRLLEIELQNNQIENERLNGEFLNNFNTLNLLCGINDTTLYNLQNIDLHLKQPLHKPSLFVSQFKIDSLSIKAQQKINELQYLPQLSAFGDAGLNATYQPTPNRLGFSVGIALKWNLFDGHQKQFKREQSQLLLSNIETDKQYLKNQNNIRKYNILKQIDNLNEQLILIDSQLNEYDKLLQLYQIEIKQSLVSVFEMKTLIKDISRKQQVKTNTLMVKEILINSYNYWNL
ncbi:MAG: TolC family protein [Bacteroidales bacterium]|jgi:outer membrane protein TolC|nr:TolC family protein [Bacteroidales bacterium]